MPTTVTSIESGIPAPSPKPGVAVPVAGPAGTPLTVARPDGPVRGGLLVIQEAWGVRDDLVVVVEKLASWGYLAVAPHLFHRVGDPVFDDDHLGDAMTVVRGLTGPQVRDDVLDALAFLDSSGVQSDRVGILGFCMGGSIALWAAATLPVAAAVTFYGGGISAGRWDGVPAGIESAAQLRAPWLGMYGDLDPSIPVEEVEALRGVLGRSGRAATIVRFADAGHGFATHPDGPRHVPAAAKEAWTRTSNWFDAHLR